MQDFSGSCTFYLDYTTNGRLNASSLRCLGAHWEVEIFCYTGSCVYRKPAHGAGDCPDGVYSLLSDTTCGDCPATITVYT